MPEIIQAGQTNLALGATLKQLLTVSRSNSRDSKDRPKIMITRVPTIDQSDMDFVYGDEAATIDATSDTDKSVLKKCTRGKLEREPNIDAEKRCLKRGIRISLERSDSFDEEYICEYMSKVPQDGQYQPLSAIEECVTPLPPVIVEDGLDCATVRSLKKSITGGSCEEDMSLYLGTAMTRLSYC